MAKANTKLKNAQEIMKEYSLSCGDFDEKELIRLRNETEEFRMEFLLMIRYSLLYPCWILTYCFQPV